jgi:hypothetical protein
MGVRIEFRGNLLYRWKDDVLRDVLLPDCSESNKEKLNGPAKNGKQHYAGILIERNGRPRIRLPLHKANVEIIGGKQAALFPKGMQLLLPDLTHHGKCVDSEHRAAAIEISGPGRWETIPELTGRVSFNSGIMPVALALAYEMDAAMILGVEHLNGGDQFVGDGDWVCIYSYEVHPFLATREALYAVHPVSNPPKSDDDFEWIYTLFTGAKQITSRPVPIIGPDPGHGWRMPDVSTCFSGGTGGG